MTVLDSFVAFARALPSNRRDAVEEALEALMASYSDDDELNADELAELKKRLDEPNPRYSDPATIAALFGKPFRA